MKAQLDKAVAQEEYSLAAKLRDKISNMRLDVESAVLEANTLFYKAFNNTDSKAMERIWGDGDFVCCMHPGSDAIFGRDLVLESWTFLL